MYRHSIATIKAKVLRGVCSTREHPEGDWEDPQLLQEHLLWMCEQVESWPMSIMELPKASRWVGWMFAKMESLGLMTNRESRDCARLDSHEIKSWPNNRD